MSNILGALGMQFLVIVSASQSIFRCHSYEKLLRHQKIDNDPETRIKIRGSKAHKNWNFWSG